MDAMHVCLNDFAKTEYHLLCPHVNTVAQAVLSSWRSGGPAFALPQEVNRVHVARLGQLRGRQQQEQQQCAIGKRSKRGCSSPGILRSVLTVAADVGRRVHHHNSGSNYRISAAAVETMPRRAHAIRYGKVEWLRSLFSGA